jgi:hypothetical protein
MQNLPPDEVALAAIKQNMNANYQFEGTLALVNFKALSEQDQASVHTIQQLNKLFQALSLSFSGAIDIEKKLFEITPALQVKQRNFKSRIAFPILLDIEGLQAYIDASALAWFDSTNTVPQDKYIHFQLPQRYKEAVKRLDIHHFYADIQKSTLQAYSNIDKKAYNFIPLSNADRQQGAIQKIRISLSADEANAFSSHMLRGSMKAVATALFPLIDESEEIRKWHDQFILFAQSGSVADQINQGMQLELTVNRHGDIMRLTEYSHFATDSATATLVLHLRLFNHGNPTFTLRPTAQNSIDFRELNIAAWAQNLLANNIFNYFTPEKNPASSLKQDKLSQKKHKK